MVSHALRRRLAVYRILLEVDGETTVEQSHEVCDVAEKALNRLFQSIVEITAHLERAVIDDARLDKQIALARTA